MFLLFEIGMYAYLGVIWGAFGPHIGLILLDR